MIWNEDEGVKNLYFRERGTEEDLPVVANEIFMAAENDQTFELEVSDGQVLVGMESIGKVGVAPSDQSLEKVDFITLNTDDVRCFPVSPVLQRDMTAVYVQYDRNGDGVMQVEEVEKVMALLGIETPAEEVTEPMYLDDFKQFLIVNTQLIEEPIALQSILSEPFKPVDLDGDLDLLADGEEDEEDYMMLILFGAIGVLFILLCIMGVCLYNMSKRNNSLVDEIIKIEEDQKNYKQQLPTEVPLKSEGAVRTET